MNRGDKIFILSIIVILICGVATIACMIAFGPERGPVVEGTVTDKYCNDDGCWFEVSGNQKVPATQSQYEEIEIGDHIRYSKGRISAVDRDEGEGSCMIPVAICLGCVSVAWFARRRK